MGVRWAGWVVLNAQWLSLFGHPQKPVLCHLAPPWPSLTLGSLLRWRRADCVLVRLLTREHLQCCCWFWKGTPGNEEEIPGLDSRAWWEHRRFLCRRWLGANHPPKSEENRFNTGFTEKSIKGNLRDVWTAPRPNIGWFAQKCISW